MTNEELQLRKVEAYARERDRYRDLHFNVASAINHGHELWAHNTIVNYAIQMCQEYTQYDSTCFNHYVLTKLIKHLKWSLIGGDK